MSDTESARLGLRHPTVVPSNYERRDDDGEQDDKVIAVPTEDPRFDHLQDLEDIPQQTVDEIDEFFTTYKNLEEGKEVETLGWEDKAAAKDAIEHALDLYQEKFA